MVDLSSLQSNPTQFKGRPVFIVTAEKKAEMRSVKIGMRLKGKVEVLEGVKAGERVVTEGLQKVRPGASVSFKDAETTEVKR